MNVYFHLHSLFFVKHATLFMDEFSSIYIVHVISNDLSVVRPPVKAFSCPY